MAKGWVKTVTSKMKKGALHRALHVPAGEKIPLSKLKAAAHGSGVTARRARLAITMREFHHKHK